MKFAGALLALSLLLPAVTAAPEYPHRLATRQNNRNGNGGGRNGGGNGGNNGNNGNNGGGNGGGNGGNGNNNGGNGNNGGNQGGNQGGDPQTSLTLDPSVIQTNLANDGLVAGAEAGQVASLTTTNNFINFCVGKTLTNGQQVVGGSCNPTPMGDIIPQSNMPSAKFLNPPNLAVIPPNQQFTVQLQVNNMQTGFFTNPQASYFGAPQQLQGGVLVAHSHVVIEKIDSLESTQVTNPQNFAFFKGLNAPAQGGVLTADVTNGLAEGVYRMASINTAANHQPALVAVAQHGSLDDIVYFTVSANGGNNGNGNGNGGNGNGDGGAGNGDGGAGNGDGGAGNGDGGAGNGNGNGNGNGGNGNGNGNNGNGNGNNGNGNGNGGNVNATPSDSASVADPAATESAAVTESAAASTASVADPAATAPPAAGGNAGNGGNNGNNGNNGRGGNRGGFGRGGFGRGGRGRGGRGRGRF